MGHLGTVERWPMSLWNSKIRREKGKKLPKPIQLNSFSRRATVNVNIATQRIFAVLAGGNSTNFNQQKL